MLVVDTFPSVAEASGAMNARSVFMGGGTLVMRDVNYGRLDGNRIVRTADAALREVRMESGQVVIGAGVTMAGVLASRDLEFLGRAARSIGGPAIRNMATVGGNLFAPPPYGDLATALLALNASVRFADGASVDIESFFGRRGTGIVRSVSVPRPEGKLFRFLKVSRVKPKGVSILTVAALLPLRAGRVEGARIAFGSMGPVPARARAAEAALEGATIDDGGIAAALRVATDGLSPSDDALATAWYRREVAPVYLRRALLDTER